MISQRKITVISLLLLALCWCLPAAVAFAAPAATITHISGPLLARKADGSTRALSIGSKVDEGDTIITQKRTYARLKFSDGGEVTLKPDTQFRVEQHSYDQGKPANDASSYNLIKGGLRAVTGQIGKRGNLDSYRMKTPTATIGIRGTIFTAEYVEPDDQKALRLPDPVLVAFANTMVASDALPVLLAAAPPSSGLFVFVWQGSVSVTNQAGSFPVPQNTGFQFTSSALPPIPIPTTAMPPFTPPPYFPPPGSGAPPSPPGRGAQGGTQQNEGGSSGGADCIMR